MSRGNHIHHDMLNPNYDDKKKRKYHNHIQINNPGEFTGEKFVKKANMTIKYTNYNKENKTDKQEWI